MTAIQSQNALGFSAGNFTQACVYILMSIWLETTGSVHLKKETAILFQQGL